MGDLPLFGGARRPGPGGALEQGAVPQPADPLLPLAKQALQPPRSGESLYTKLNNTCGKKEFDIRRTEPSTAVGHPAKLISHVNAVNTSSGYYTQDQQRRLLRQNQLQHHQNGAKQHRLSDANRCPVAARLQTKKLTTLTTASTMGLRPCRQPPRAARPTNSTTPGQRATRRTLRQNSQQTPKDLPQPMRRSPKKLTTSPPRAPS